MAPNDHLPDGPSSRTITIHLTRDTLILVAALGLLGLAILLAVIFPSGEPQPTANSATSGTSTNTAGRSTAVGSATASAANPTSGAYPQLEPTTSANTDANAYPGQATPGAGQAARQAATATAAPGGAATPTPGPPTFAPTRSSISTSIPDQATAYPVPGSDTTQPTPPIFTTPTAQRSGDQQATTAATRTAAATGTPSPAPTRAQQTETPEEATRAPAPTARPAATRTPPPPTAVPVDVIRSNTRWTVAQSPLVIPRNLQLAPGVALVIDPGVEVRLAPGVSFFVEGSLFAAGQPDRPVRFVSHESQRWEGMFGRPGSSIVMEQTEIRGGGNGGTVLASAGGMLSLRAVHINDNGGHVQVTDSRLEVRDTEIAGNDMPYGAALDASYTTGGGFVALVNNRIGGNRMSFGTAQVHIENQSTLDTLNLDVQRNLLVGQDGPNLALSTDGPLQGGLMCNTLVKGAEGLSIRTQTLQVPGVGLNVRDNAIEDHTPPIIPIYLEFGIGRGATSEVALDMRNNWWDSADGPYEPDRHADGRGEAVGDTIEFAPWLTARPACAPVP